METVIRLPGLARDQSAGGVEIVTTGAMNVPSQVPRDQNAGGVEIKTTGAMTVPNQVPSRVERAAKVLTKRQIATICEHQNARDARMLGAWLEDVLGVGRQATT